MSFPGAADRAGAQDNVLFMGGQHGGRGALMVHAVPGLRGAARLGDSGLFVGGIADAMGRVAAGDRACADFKFFFNVCKFGPGELDAYVAEGRWHAYAGVPPDLILRQDPDADAGALWSELRALAKGRT